MSASQNPRPLAERIALGDVCGKCAGTGVVFSPMNATGRNKTRTPCPICTRESRELLRPAAVREARNG